MQTFATRRRRVDVPRFLLSVSFIFLLLLVTFSVAHAALNMYGKFAEAAASNDASQQNLKDLQTQEASVQAQVDALVTPEGQEAQLRQSYGVALPGEGEIQLVQKNDATTASAASQGGNIFVQILRALFVW